MVKVKTIVIGFGSGADPDQLNAIAGSGGTTFTSYIDASSGTELTAALDTIAQTVVVGCTFEIGQYDPEVVDLEFMNIRLDGNLVPRDDDCNPGTGWKWTDNSRTAIEFCEQACNDLKNGNVDEIQGEIACRPQDVIIL